MPLDDKQRLTLLTALGGAFPLRDRMIAGRTVRVFDRDPRTLRDAFAATAAYGDGLAVGYAGEYWTYDDMWTEMTRLAAALSAGFGIAKGDRVGIAMRNYPEFVFAFGAIQLLGAVAAPAVEVSPDDLASILFTSGTLGQRRGPAAARRAAAGGVQGPRTNRAGRDAAAAHRQRQDRRQDRQAAAVRAA